MFRRVAAALLALALVGCMADKASHQNGFILYLSTSGQLGLGYGETEDLPAGCVFLRVTETQSPAFWGSGTNVTRTATFWDTRGMTNVCERITEE